MQIERYYLPDFLIESQLAGSEIIDRIFPNQFDLVVGEIGSSRGDRGEGERGRGGEGESVTA